MGTGVAARGPVALLWCEQGVCKPLMVRYGLVCFLLIHDSVVKNKISRLLCSYIKNISIGDFRRFAPLQAR
jgi:hypothetical protein